MARVLSHQEVPDAHAMSVRLMGAVFYLDLPSQEKLLLLAICDHTDDDGQQAFPSQVRLAKKASVSTRTVNRLTHALEGRGLISVKPGSGLETTRYYVNVERVIGQGGPDNLSGGSPDAGVRGGPDTRVRTVLTNPVGGPDIAMSAEPSVTTTTKKPSGERPHAIQFQIPASISKALDRCSILGAAPMLRKATYWQAQVRAYGRVDIAAELLEAESWMAANPTRRRKSDFGAFVRNWLARALRDLREDGDA